MDANIYHIESYLSPQDSFHFARKRLSDEIPSAPHTHDYFELLLVESGEAHHWINGTEQFLSQGALVFVRPDDTHRLHAGAGATCRLLNIMFRCETAEHLAARYAPEVSERYFWSTEPLPASFLLTGKRLTQAMDMTLELQNGPKTLGRLEQHLLMMMTRILDVPETVSINLPTWLVTACEQARSPEVFRDGAAGFVRVAGRGHEHVCRKTKEYLGVTPSTFVNRIRMEHAAQLLADEDISVNDVADACGIENMSHFYRVFRQHYGVTPKAYRRRHQLNPF